MSVPTLIWEEQAQKSNAGDANLCQASTWAQIGCILLETTQWRPGREMPEENESIFPFSVLSSILQKEPVQKILRESWKDIYYFTYLHFVMARVYTNLIF